MKKNYIIPITMAVTISPQYLLTDSNAKRFSSDEIPFGGEDESGRTPGSRRNHSVWEDDELAE